LQIRKQAYQVQFGPPGTAGHEFLVDILHFCRVCDDRWSNDPRHHARLEGRAEVGRRILDHLHLEPEEIAALYKAVRLRKVSEGE
jgi:hypothetical protein